MKWSFSNIAWTAQQDEYMYRILAEAGISGLEIAPTRIFPQQPYQKMAEIREWSKSLYKRYGLRISSMQSIWYGRTQNLFADEQQYAELMQYSKEAVLFAEAAECPHLVFGCPKNRNMPEGADRRTALAFFLELSSFAAQHGIVIGMEANPSIYGTNFINTTQEAIAIVREIGNDGLELNLDIGTMLANAETADVIAGAVSLIHHVHISEPYLKPVQERELHRDILRVLDKEGYQGYISVEMSDTGDSRTILEVLEYIQNLEGKYGIS